MSHEKKKFIDGLLVGAFLVGLIVAILILIVFLYAPSPEEDFTTPRQSDVSTDNQNLGETRPIPEKSINTQLFEKVSVNGDEYTVIQELKHPKKDIIFRLLAKNREDLAEKLDKYKSSEFLQSFNGDTAFSTFADDESWQNRVAFSIWTKDGQELLVFDDNNQDVPKAPVGSVTVVDWLNDDLMIESSQGDAGFGSDELYLYDPSTRGVKRFLSYETGWNVDPDTGNEFIYTSWNNDKYRIGQVLDTSSGKYSNLYYLPLRDVDWANYRQNLIAYQTASEIGVEIKSNENLANYQKGLEISVEGQNVFIPWIIQ